MALIGDECMWDEPIDPFDIFFFFLCLNPPFLFRGEEGISIFRTRFYQNHFHHSSSSNISSFPNASFPFMMPIILEGASESPRGPFQGREWPG